MKFGLLYEMDACLDYWAEKLREANLLDQSIVDKKKEYARAIEAYNGALIGMPEEAAIYSNRSVCYLKEKEYDKALSDAETCIKLMPEW